MRRLMILLLAAALTGSTGCTIVYNVDRQVPAEIFLGNEVRVIGVSPFDANEEDFKLAVSEKLSGRLAGSKVFDVVTRTRIDAAIAEIEETSTDYYDQDTAVAFGKLVAADALIFGRCTTYSNDEQINVTLTKLEEYYVEEMVEKNGQLQKVQVKKYREHQVQAPALQRSMSVELNFKAVNVETGVVVGGEALSSAVAPMWILNDPHPEWKTTRKPKDVVEKVVDARVWCSQTIDQLSAAIARKLIPQTVREQIIWERVPRYAEEAEKYFQHGQFQTAASHLEADLSRAGSDNQLQDPQRAALNYLLGVTYACQQRYDESLKLLQIAADLAPNDLHIGMISRVRQWKKDAEDLAQQIQG